MRNPDGRRWEKGASASEMEAFIFLFCWSANVLKVEGEEKKPQRNERWAQRGRIISYRATQWRIFHSWSVPGGYTEPLFIAFIGEDMKELSSAPVNSHFCCQFSPLRGENSIYFLTVTYTCAFFLCHSRWKHVCDHRQHFPFLKCLLLLLLCQFVNEENGSWKTLLFGFALSMETGP